MRNLNFKYAAACNFLPFGPEGIELNFKNYKNIVVIRGNNYDSKNDQALTAEEFRLDSNGTGKSSLQEIVVFGLFGKTVKRPEKLNVNDVVHNKVKQDCKIELIFDDYRIIRTRKEGGKDKHSLRLWHSPDGIWDKTTEITQGTMSTTQKQIESILGLSYEAFVNISIFTDDQRSCFLECDKNQKKEIVENLLSLGEYREWFDNAKALKKEIKGKIDIKSKEYQMLLSNKDDANRRLTLTKNKEKDWILNIQKEIAVLEKSIISKSNELASTDVGAALLEYQEAQVKILEINNQLPILEEANQNLSKTLKSAKEKESVQKEEAQKLVEEYNEFSNQAKTHLVDRKKKEAEIIDLQSNTPGANCGKCRGVIDQENIVGYIEILNREINEINLTIKALMESAKNISRSSEELKEKQTKVNSIIKNIEDKISKNDAEMRVLLNTLTKASKIREPKADSAEFLIEQQREELKKQVENKKLELSSPSPFQDIIDNDNLELEKIIKNVEDKEKEVKDLEGEMPYLDYWISGFGDHGIRKWIIDGIIPELNNRINYWLQFLIDNKIKLSFDNELHENIERNPIDGDPYVYHAMSTGQRRRLNLAVSQSFAHIMTLSTGSIPSIVFLDEVSTNVDVNGNVGIYNMILELSQDKQVFITTHDQNLLQMLEGCDTIDLVHKDGFTKIIQ